MTSTERPPLIASYRIQLTPEFGFADTMALLDHLTSLGVSHLYLSPVAEAVPGSTHGYDVVDHTTVRAEFGGEVGLLQLLDAAEAHGLGVIVDHVPNHMSVADAERNERWWAMLRDGPESEAARWFDVDWDFGGKVLLPKLGDRIDDVIDAGQLSIEHGRLGAELRYGPLRFPLRAGTEDLDTREALRSQHYELMWWRDPRRNVRRFFAIDDLVAIRVDRSDVASVVDSIPARLCGHRAFAGVRVDHVDGLADPERYLDGLRALVGADRWLLVEKILAPGEMLPPSWPVDGTTGYEHVRATEHAFLESAAESPLTDLWTELTGDVRAFDEIEGQAVREVLDEGLAPDLDRLVRLVAARHDLADARMAAIELTVALHRYRTYLRPDRASHDAVPDGLQEARDRAVVTRPDLIASIDGFLDVLLDDPDVASRWQQLTGPAMAKGAEDRAFFRYLRLASLCEVGGSPGVFSVPVADFHRHQLAVQSRMPRTLLAGTTHDTKRSEGVRARSLALAEVADEWASTVRAWIARSGDAVEGVDPATLLLALQTAVTAWPIDRGRLTEFLVKSTREADGHTSWTDPDEAYEAALGHLAATLESELEPSSGTELAGLTRRLLRPGWSNSLAALAVRLSSPGVADLYQGTSAFTYSLVDPDNRVEPDWDERRALAATARTLDGPTAWLGEHPDAATSVVIERLLRLRRRRTEAFGDVATYTPLEFSGPHADRLLGFARGSAAGPLLATIVVCRSIGLDDWAETRVGLPAGAWTNVMEDDSPVIAGGVDVAVSWWLDRFPVAVLERTAP